MFLFLFLFCFNETLITLLRPRCLFPGHCWEAEKQRRSSGTWLLLELLHVAKPPGGAGLIGVVCFLFFFVRWLRLKPWCAAPASCEATTAAWVKYAIISRIPATADPQAPPPSSQFDGSLLMRNKLNDLHPARPCRQPFMQSRRAP